MAEAKPARLLVVCLGNICRSPMAEGALRMRLAEAGLAHVHVDSAGTGGWHVGEPPDRRAIACAGRHGVDISMLRARKLQAADADRFDLLLCADRDNLRDVAARVAADARDRCLLLSEYAGQGMREVPDPYTGGDREFDHAWDLVDDMARDIARKLA